MPEDKLLEWAQVALANNDPLQASKYYEEYANKFIFGDKERAALYFSLATQYDRSSLKQPAKLYQNAFQLYRKSGNSVSAADMLMALGLLYLKNGEKDTGIKKLKKCVIMYLDFIKTLVLQEQFETANNNDQAIDQLHKIEYCLKQIFAEKD